MPRPIITIAATLALGAALAAPGSEPAHGGEKLMDYELVQRVIPELRELNKHGSENIAKLHALFDELDGEAAITTPERKKLGEAAKVTLEDHLATKKEVVAKLRTAVDLPATGRADKEVMAKLHGTTLHGIRWNDATFRKCVNDLAGALGLRIRMAYHVVQMNRVSLDFNEANAATVLTSLCNFFHLRYTVVDGEIMLFKKLTPNEERYLDYQKKHPEAKLRYWDRETAGGEYDKEKKKKRRRDR